MRFSRTFAPMVICSALAAAALAPAAATATPPIGAYTTKGAYTFVSAPNLHPPKLHTDAPTVSSKLAPGYFMTTNFKNLTSALPMVGEGGPLILDSHLQPVWFDPIGTNVVGSNLRAQMMDGKPVLSWWQGVISSTGATTSGEDVVVDQHYRTVATLKGQNGWVISTHEMMISGHDAWVTSYRNVPLDLAPYGGLTNGVLTDAAVQEYNLENGQLLETWDALQHIPLTLSQTHPSPVAGLTGPIPWDAYHVNSIQLQGYGSFLVSMRNTWAAYMVGATGAIEWTLGGKDSSFALPLNAQFQWQHDVELHPGNVVSVFDDACCAITGPGTFGPPSGPSRGLVLKLNPSTHTGTLVSQYEHGGGFNAAFLGDTQLLPDGNVLVGWGSQPYFSEYAKSGKLLLDAVWPTPNVNYRAYLQSWVGKPFFPPSGAAHSSHGKATLYASWDGATLLAGWNVLAGPGPKHLTVVAHGAKNGFETVIPLGANYKSFKVQALDGHGHVLGTSKSFSVPKPHAAPGPPGFY
jgi:Arylsulfotransferase (ASST)